MTSESAPDVKLEIGHVLFFDVVGYSRLLIDDQRRLQEQLNQIVRQTRQFREGEAAGKLLRLPVGDGMALVFFNDPKAPIECATEIAAALKHHPAIQIRMGIHSGPINEVLDVNERTNVAGAGIDIAQRVMDCGDAGHILLSKRVADDLTSYSRWNPHLHEIGECETKHGRRISLVNFYTDEIGNSHTPRKCVQSQNESAGSRRRLTNIYFLALALVGLLILAAAASRFVGTGRPSVQKESVAEQGRQVPASPSIPEKSIAVLPFENVSDEKENVFFADGVQDEILTNLAKVADLKVISRTSVMGFRDTKRNLREIGQALGVAHIVEGSVQRANGRVRVSAQLIDSRTDTHLWAERYDRELADVFAIQSEIAQKIVAQLKATLSPKEQKAIAAKPTSDIGAYDLYLRAKEVWRSASFSRPAKIEEQVQLLEQAVARDPAYVAALCQLARAHLGSYWFKRDYTPARLERARKALDAAARLQPDDGDVHLTRGIFHYWGSRDYESALAEFALARHALPNDADVLNFIAAIERRQGRWQESTRHYEEATILDPRNGNIFFQLAWTNYIPLKRYADAARTFDNLIAWQPNDFMFQLARARVDVFSKADLTRQQKILNSEAANISQDTELVTRARLFLALAQRDYQTAQQVLSTYQLSEFRASDYMTPREFFDGIVARGLGDAGKAHAFFAAARERAATVVAKQPDDYRARVVLAEIEANLGRKADAIREAEQALELIPVETDHYDGPVVLWRTAGVYAQVGDTNRALDLLEQAAKLPSGPDYGSLKLDEVWDSLRREPRFEKIIASLAPK